MKDKLDLFWLVRIYSAGLCTVGCLLVTAFIQVKALEISYSFSIIINCFAFILISFSLKLKKFGTSAPKTTTKRSFTVQKHSFYFILFPMT